MKTDRQFPESMVPLKDSVFYFHCHPRVECFTLCCRNVNMILYPYDVIMLKRSLEIDSEEFLRRHTLLERVDNPYFPTVKLRLKEDGSKVCPFLGDNGCTVYENRPTACRTYPLERAVDRTHHKGAHEDFYFLTRHSYCLGHNEQREINVKEWLRNQHLFEYNMMNDLWAEIDTIFSSNPWRGEGDAGEKQQLAFLVCYNIDGFRKYMQSHKLLKYFQLNKEIRRRILSDDNELLKFGFEWLKLLLSDCSSLIKK
ncbi:MAG: YkgJ family cysteine cluster protein [Pseudomonadota bacterium]